MAEITIPLDSIDVTLGSDQLVQGRVFLEVFVVIRSREAIWSFLCLYRRHEPIFIQWNPPALPPFQDPDGNFARESMVAQPWALGAGILSQTELQPIIEQAVIDKVG